jgi:hypothetical protein
MAMHNVMATVHATRVQLKYMMKPLSQILKRTTTDTIKSMIGHSLPTFEMTDKTKTDTNIDEASTED